MVQEVVNWRELTQKQQTIVETYHGLNRQSESRPSDEEVAANAYEGCPDSYVHYLRTKRAPYMFEEEPVEVQARLHENPQGDSLGELLANAPVNGFAPGEEGTLISLYQMARSRGYSTGDLAPVREVILTESDLVPEDLEQ